MGLWILWYLKSIKTYISLHVALVLFRATLVFQPTSSDKAWDNFLSTTMKFTFWVNKWMKIRISCCSIHTCEILILFSSRWNTLSALLSLLCRATGINMLAIPREKCRWLKGTTNYTHSAHAQVWVPSFVMKPRFHDLRQQTSYQLSTFWTQENEWLILIWSSGKQVQRGITYLKYVYSDLITLHLKLYPRNQAVGLNFKSRAKIIWSRLSTSLGLLLSSSVISNMAWMQFLQKRSRKVISGFMLLDWCFSNENVSRACVYISKVSISTAVHILACLVLNFAKMLQPGGPHSAADHNSFCTQS